MSFRGKSGRPLTFFADLVYTQRRHDHRSCLDGFLLVRVCPTYRALSQCPKPDLTRQIHRYDQGVMSGLISAPQFFRVFPACDPARQGAYKGTLLYEASREAVS